MIKANELRINNYVYINENIKQVDVIDYNQVIATESGLIELKYIKPIPLTEEWLLKFGFGIDKDYDDTFFNNIALEQAVILYNTKYKLFTLETDRGDEIQIECEYVHQLQNLYFALTNEELKIKEYE